MKSLTRILVLISVAFTTSATAQTAMVAQMILDAEFQMAEAKIKADLEVAAIEREQDARMYWTCTCVAGMPVYGFKSWAQMKQEANLRQAQIQQVSRQIEQQPQFAGLLRTAATPKDKADLVLSMATKIVTECKG